MTGADNQLITVRVRQVSADLGYINIDICPDIGKVSVYGKWSLIREVVEGRYYCSRHHMGAILQLKYCFVSLLICYVVNIAKSHCHRLKS